MMNKLFKAYVYLYWRLSLWSRSSFDFFDNWYKWKGELAVDVIVLLLLTTTVNLFLSFNDDTSLPKNLLPILIVISLLIAFTNKYIFGRPAVDVYIKHFEQHDRREIIRYGFYVFGFLLLVAISLVGSFWLLAIMRGGA